MLGTGAKHGTPWETVHQSPNHSPIPMLTNEVFLGDFCNNLNDLWITIESLS